MDTKTLDKVHTLLDKGIDSNTIATKLGLTVPQVAAVKAWRTMRENNQGDKLSGSDAKNYRYYRVTGSYVVRATSKSDAVRATQRASVPGTSVLVAETEADRITRTEVDELISD